MTAVFPIFTRIHSQMCCCCSVGLFVSDIFNKTNIAAVCDLRKSQLRWRRSCQIGLFLTTNFPYGLTKCLALFREHFLNFTRTLGGWDNHCSFMGGLKRWLCRMPYTVSAKNVCTTLARLLLSCSVFPAQFDSGVFLLFVVARGREEGHKEMETACHTLWGIKIIPVGLCILMFICLFPR